MHRFLLLIAALVFSTSTALAGDFARRDILGFSKDGSLFAFEEYGIQDGSGFPYSNIFVINTITDRWTAGSPFRVRLEDIDEANYDEGKLMARARNKVREMAASVLAKITQPGLIVASNQPTERSAIPGRIEFLPRMTVPPIDETVTLTIDTYPLDGGANCDGLGETRGFTLTRLSKNAENPDLIMHRDTKLPKSRSCPLDYSFADSVTYFTPKGKTVLVILILMNRFGFEGPDGRYLAVTGSLD